MRPTLCLALSLSSAALAATALAAAAGPGIAAPDRIGAGSPITTLAGTGDAGYSGDGGPAADASMTQPRDTAVGPDGSIFVADTLNNRVRRIDPSGTVTTYAGTGVGGYSGDGGPAVDAQLAWPHDVTVDARGNLYIADSNNQRIRKVDTDGVITTIAGTGKTGYNGDDRPAVTALLKYPKSVALQGHALYFADSLNQRIRKVNLNTGMIKAVAGSGVKGFGGDGGPAELASFDVPQRIAFDSAGNLFIADTRNNRIRQVDAATGTIRTVVGTGVSGYGGDGGPAVHAAISVPRGLALADDATLYIADSGNHVIRRVNLANGVIRTVVGTGEPGYAGDGGAAGAARLRGPRGLSVDLEGDLVIADTLNNVVRIVSR